MDVPTLLKAIVQALRRNKVKIDAAHTVLSADASAKILAEHTRFLTNAYPDASQQPNNEEKIQQLMALTLFMNKKAGKDVWYETVSEVLAVAPLDARRQVEQLIGTWLHLMEEQRRGEDQVKAEETWLYRVAYYKLAEVEWNCTHGRKNVAQAMLRDIVRTGAEHVCNTIHDSPKDEWEQCDFFHTIIQLQNRIKQRDIHPGTAWKILLNLLKKERNRESLLDF